MFSVEKFRDVNERPTAAAEEICDDATRAAVEDEAEINRQRRMMDIIWSPHNRIDVSQQHVCKEEEDEQQLCHQERKSSLDQEGPEPPQIKEEQEGEQLKQEETDTSALNQHILTYTDVPQQHVCKEEEDEQQLCHQERKSSLDQEEPETPQMKEEQEGEQLKQEETDTSALNLQIITYTDVPHQHVCKEEEDEQQLCHQERKSSLDQEEPDPPQMKEEQEGEWIKQKETDTSALNRHTLTHIGMKLYTCGTCGISFNQKCQLDSHIEIRAGAQVAEWIRCPPHVRGWPGF
ncbi:UPF0746 protein DDB_G0281095-like isoform X4 [Cheilinus undulatus]|uniref:UPF0746 protein DDB_G0281095-like isoform X4 n=1 Tax=Cheilinus undulatus TaxID=241271 RepID=UPI001BD43409|nr:UPF0746 protein DDB_G0281095-like isoform X4 [Cheilinus undulatus]